MKKYINCTLIFLGTVALVAGIVTEKSVFIAMWMALWMATLLTDLFPLPPKDF